MLSILGLQIPTPDLGSLADQATVSVHSLGQKASDCGRKGRPGTAMPLVSPPRKRGPRAVAGANAQTLDQALGHLETGE